MMVTLTETNINKTETHKVDVNYDSIETMKWDSEYACTDINLKSGRSLSVIESPARISSMTERV